MVLLPLIGLSLWIAFLLAVFILSCIIWAVFASVGRLLDLTAALGKRKKVRTAKRSIQVTSKPRNVPRTPHRPEASQDPQIWRKWNDARRRYVDGELSAWQEQFEALASRRL